MSHEQRFPALYLSSEHECPYLPGQTSVSMLLDPHQPVSDSVFSQAVKMGFRRSGELVYRPYCRGCEACVPVRIPVEKFTPNRSQRRTMKTNSDLSLDFLPPDYSEAHFQLYCRYQRWKHTGDSMDHSDRERYKSSMLDSTANTALGEFRLGNKVAAVMVLDVVDDGLSAVYTFFDPEMAARSLGTFAILTLVEQARRVGLSYVYLGYWIEACQKMRYKQNFRPVEAFICDQWVDLQQTQAAQANGEATSGMTGGTKGGIGSI